MGKVFLVPSHHELENLGARVELTEEMLLWPIFRDNSSNKKSFGKKDYRKAFKALLKLEGFTTVISIGIDLKEKKMYPVKRCWGYIFLEHSGKELIVESFSHYPDNSPFYTIDEWPGNRKDPTKWTIDRWKKFFIDRIREKTLKDLCLANKEADEASLVLEQQQKITKNILEVVNIIRIEK